MEQFLILAAARLMPALAFGQASAFNNAVSNGDSMYVIAELKWLKEFGNKNRLEGETWWLNIVGKFQVTDYIQRDKNMIASRIYTRFVFSFVLITVSLTFSVVSAQDRP